MPATITPRLAALLAGAPAGAPVEVVVELAGRAPEPTGSRGEQVAAARAAFERDAAAVRRTVAAAGGEVLDVVWLNRTLLVRVPASGIAAVAADAGVAVVDLPRRLESDGPGP